MYQNQINEYIFECRIKNMSERTIKGYKNNNEHLFNYLKGEFDVTDVTQVTRKQIKSFINFKLTQHNKASYINSLIKSFRSFFKYLKEEEYIKVSPMDNIPLLKDKITVIKTFTDADIKKILKQLQHKTYLDMRNRLLINMFIDTGMRCREACILPMSAIKDGYILILGKGNKERVVPCSVVLNKLIIKYILCRENYFKYKDIPDNLFLSRTGKPLTDEAIKSVINIVCKQAKIKGIRTSPHTFRHYYAQKMLQTGTDIYSLSRLLGHSNISITQRYLNSISDTQILNDNIDNTPLCNL